MLSINHHLHSSSKSLQRSVASAFTFALSTWLGFPLLPRWALGLVRTLCTNVAKLENTSSCSCLPCTASPCHVASTPTQVTLHIALGTSLSFSNGSTDPNLCIFIPFRLIISSRTYSELSNRFNLPDRSPTTPRQFQHLLVHAHLVHLMMKDLRSQQTCAAASQKRNAAAAVQKSCKHHPPHAKCDSEWVLGSFASGGLDDRPPCFQFVLWDANTKLLSSTDWMTTMRVKLPTERQLRRYAASALLADELKGLKEQRKTLRQCFLYFRLEAPG